MSRDDDRANRVDRRKPPPPTPRPERRFSRREGRAVTILCSIYALRIIGLYMVLPVLSPYAATLRGASGLLTGLAIGAYGLSQAIFQIPFGSLSDRIGRRRTLVLGLLLFALGSAVAATGKTVLVLVIGRLLQGMGAIASVVVALVADLTRSQVRTQAMARLGIWVGGSFAVGMTVGPLVAARTGVPFLFWVTAGLSILGSILLYVGVPEPRRRGRSGEERVHKEDLGYILGQPALAFLDLGTFLLHLTLTAIFVVLPFVFEQNLGPGGMWKVVTPVVVGGVVTMALVARHSDRPGGAERVLQLGGGLFCLGCLIFSIDGSGPVGSVAGLAVFVLGVACLEPALPALTSRFAVGRHRGAAMGVFHMSQFLGSFVGGLVGGAFLHGPLAVPFGCLAAMVLVWLGISRRLERMEPAH